MAEIIKFAAGISEILALKYTEGKNCTGKFGPQVQYTTTDERVFWLDPEPASDVERELAALGIRPGQEFRLTKVKTTHGGHRFAVEKQPDMRRDTGGHNVPERGNVYRDTNPAPTAQPVAPVALPGTSTSAGANATCMMAAMCAAIDAVIETQAYATRRGLGVTFSEESVRAIGLSIYISNCKGGR